jgi:DNA-binding PadR family transcriptional regulator
MNRDEFARNLAAGTYDLIVLDVLHRGPNYGYGIVKRIFEQSKHTICWHEGTLYPVLHRLEKRGLLVSEWKGPKDGRQRRYYRLTTRGRQLWREQREQWSAFSRRVSLLLGM